MRRLLIIALLIVGTNTVSSEEPTPFSTAVGANTVAVSFDADGLSGQGGDWLKKRAAAAQLIGFGEQHASADIAKFAQSWFVDLDAMDYDHAVIEVGPWSTRAAELLLREEGHVFEQDAAGRAGGLAYPFLFFQEEADFARAVVERHEGAGPALWGVDQEFVAGGSILADRLEALATSPEQRDAVAELRARLLENSMLVGTGAVDGFAGLEAAFEQGDKEARAIVSEIIRSNRIYMPFTGRGSSVYAANLEREQGMKTNFLQAWGKMVRAGGASPKLFFKFGGFHMQRGHSGTDVQSFGNFLSEWGYAQGLEFFNVMVDCNGGQVTDPRSGEASACESYFAIQGSEFEGLAKNGSVVINLEALRPFASKDTQLNADLRKLIFAYDAYVILPNVAPASKIAID